MVWRAGKNRGEPETPVVQDSARERTREHTNPSYNAPVFTGTDNGTVAVTLLANADTEGYTPAYIGPTKTWTHTADVI